MLACLQSPPARTPRARARFRACVRARACAVLEEATDRVPFGVRRRSAQSGNKAFFNSAIPVFLQVSALRKIWRVLGFARWLLLLLRTYYSSQWF